MTGRDVLEIAVAITVILLAFAGVLVAILNSKSLSKLKEQIDGMTSHLVDLTAIAAKAEGKIEERKDAAILKKQGRPIAKSEKRPKKPSHDK